tara:strand:+ start:844 stop:987 length:144 start_codon:yes stop_codon:yes gene_type:complete
MSSEWIDGSHHCDLGIAILDAVLIDANAISPDANESAFISEVPQGAM